MKEGEFWRAQIVWPNGAVNFFGKFASELEAQRWINGHSWLTAHVVEDSKFAAVGALAAAQRLVGNSTAKQRPPMRQLRR